MENNFIIIFTWNCTCLSKCRPAEKALLALTAPGVHSVYSQRSPTPRNYCTTSWDIVGCFLSTASPSMTCFRTNSLPAFPAAPQHQKSLCRLRWLSRLLVPERVYGAFPIPSRHHCRCRQLKSVCAFPPGLKRRVPEARNHSLICWNTRQFCFFNAWRMAAVSIEASRIVQGESGRLENTVDPFDFHHHIYNVLYF